MRAYPQKHTVFIFILCVLVVGSVAAYVFQGKNAARAALNSSLKTVEVSTQPVSTTIMPDTDWRKQFLTASSTSFVASKSTEKQEPFVSPTATYSLGQNFITQYVVLRQSGQNEDTEAVKASMNQVASKSIDAIDGPKVYTIAHVMMGDDDVATRSAYAKVIGTIHARYDGREDEADVAALAFENEDVSRLTQLDPLIADYRSMINTLLAVRVPKSLAQYHVNLLNGLSALTYSTEAFRHMDTDPMKGYAAIRTDAIGMQAADNMFYMINQSLTGSLVQR